MTSWLEKNKSRLIRFTFLIPIISVAAISISHVVSWYDLANPVSWAIYLSIAVEIAAMSAIAAASVKIRGFSVWFVFSIVTLIQFIGNIYFSYSEIDVMSKPFKDWMELITPITNAMGSTGDDYIAQRRLLAILEGGLLPLISLTCLHFFIGYQESETKSLAIKEIDEFKDEPVLTESISTEIQEETGEPIIINEEVQQIDNEEKLIDLIEEKSVEPVEVEPNQSKKIVKPTRDIGAKVHELSHKMKKILKK